MEVEESSLPQPRWWPSADGRRHLGARRTICSPGRRHAYNHAGAFKLLHIAQELHGLCGNPPERVENLSCVDHGLKPRTALGRTLDREKQGEQPVSIFRTGILPQGLAEWNMLSLGVRGKPRRVGGKKGERRGFILAVFGKIEVHATDQVPRRIAPLQKLLDAALRFRQFSAKRPIELLPEIAQDCRAQVLGACHRRRSQHKLVEF